jgi:hypothetical protein
VYGLYGKKENVKNVHLPSDHHDYAFTKRIPMYKFFADVFSLNLNAIKNKRGEIDESSITIETALQQQVFSKENPMPVYALKSHEEIVKAFAKALKGE